MIGRTKGMLIAGAAVVACALLVSWGLVHHRSDDTALTHSLEVLLASHLMITYRIQSSVLNSEDTDQVGQWWIVLSKPPTQESISQWSSMLMRADEADISYYRQQISESLSPSIPLNNFKLLKGEIALGPGSICEQLPCNIEVLLTDESAHLFVTISKI